MSDISAFANRLGKNIKHYKKWAERKQIGAWRAYDRDVPQFPFSLDLYGDRVHLQEYETGWLMSDAEHEAWLKEVYEAIQFVTGLPQEAIAYKTRRRQKGAAQYEKTGIRGVNFVVEEFGLRFWVNLDNYLDTGLFLDHRNTRQKVREESSGKRVLNLFAYTGSFSVYAASGGAIFSESVDLSNTYLDWARRNFILNNVDFLRHKLVRADVLCYLDDALNEGKQFDLIVMDPPSFSNSKKMLDTLDIQRDHANLIERAMLLLSKNGVMYFSNNLRSFTLDEQILQRYQVTDISAESIPEDFRNKKIHQCWRISLNISSEKFIR